MPTLPTLTVTDDQATRILAAYKAKFGTTTDAETVKAYKAWLQDQVVEAVLAFEHERAKADAEAQIAADLDTLRATLPGAPPPPTAEEQARADLIAAQIASITPGATK